MVVVFFDVNDGAKLGGQGEGDNPEVAECWLFLKRQMFRGFALK